MSAADARVHGIPVGPFQSNAYVVSQGGEALVIDPGAEAGRIAAYVEHEGFQVLAILLTHGHLDHLGAARELEARWDVSTFAHPADRFLIDALPEACALYGLPALEPPARVCELAGGRRFRAGSAELETVEAPGHSPGHVIFTAAGFAIVGDLIFAGSVGRVDLPGGDAHAMLRSIESAVLQLPGGTVLYPGHGPPTTVEEERRTNPFLAPGAIG